MHSLVQQWSERAALARSKMNQRRVARLEAGRCGRAVPAIL